MFLHEGYMVRNPRGVSDRVYQTDLMNLVGLLFIHFFFEEAELMMFFLDRVGVRPCVDILLHYYRTKVWNFLVIPCKYIPIFFKEGFVSVHLIRGACLPQ